MACHCFSWATGQPTCIGIIGDSRVETCRRACRERGMAALCWASAGDCGVDVCSDGIVGITSCRFYVFVVSEPPPADYEVLFFDHAQVTVLACAVFSDLAVALTNAVSDARNNYISRLMALYGVSHERIIVLFPSTLDPWWSAEEIHACNPTYFPTLGLRTAGPCSRSKTPCCFDFGTTRCKFITPADCVSQCGQPFEGTIAWSNPSNPCAIVGVNYPCDRHACCVGQYPADYPRSDDLGMGGQFAFTGTRSGDPNTFCDVRTSSGCGNIGGQINSNTRSCFEPGGCFGGSDPGHSRCVGGTWELTYRPAEHTPPQEKAWLDGSAEICSTKPERPMFPAQPQTCAYHYGDVAYSRDKGDAAGVMCAKLPARRSSVNRCPDYYVNDWCPLVYGADGNARFNCGYRVAG